MFNWKHEAQDRLEATLFAHVEDRAFPCVGAKSAMAKGTLDVLACSRIDSAWDDVRIHDSLMRLAERYRQDRAMYRSFAVVFEGPDDLSEPAFERALWDRVQSLSDKDVWRGQDYDPRVSTDPDNPHFSLSFGGEAFFIVGLHPNASRPARRFERPTLVFNRTTSSNGCAPRASTRSCAKRSSCATKHWREAATRCSRVTVR